jgi:hypothetical protein
MSAVLMTTMAKVKTIMEAPEAAGIRDNVKVVVGGTPYPNGTPTRCALSATGSLPASQCAQPWSWSEPGALRSK